MFQVSEMLGSLELSRCALETVTPSTNDGPLKPPGNPEQKFARNRILFWSETARPTQTPDIHFPSVMNEIGINTPG